MERRVRLHGDELDAPPGRAQPAARADERAARAEPRDEVRHVPVCLLEDLDARRVEVRAPVGVAAVLIRVEVPVRILSVNPPGLQDGAVAPLHRIGEDEIRAIRLEHLPALAGHVRRHAELHQKAARGAEQGVGDARVARRGVEQHLARAQGAAALTVLDHREGGAVLDGAAGVMQLELRVNLDPRLGLKGLEADERRITDSESGGCSRM